MLKYVPFQRISFIVIIMMEMCSEMCVALLIAFAIITSAENIGDDNLMTYKYVKLSLGKPPKCAQHHDFSCGPAVGRTLLFHLGMRRCDRLERINEDSMINRMDCENPDGHSHPVFDAGTLAKDFVQAVNGYIEANNLNNNKIYQRYYLNPSIESYNPNDHNVDRGYYADYRTRDFWRMSRLVFNSLQNNAPVALLANGNRPSVRSGNEERHLHFILIYGVETSDIGVKFFILDPATGEDHTIDTTQLNGVLYDGGDLFFHDPYAHSQITSVTK